MDIKQGKVDIKKKTEEDVINDLFDSLVTKGHITREVTVGDTKFVLKALSTKEVLDAETVYIASLSSIPADIVSRVRVVSGLAHSIVSINDYVVPTEDEEEVQAARENLHKSLMKLPPSVIDTLSAQYRELISEQGKLYKNATENIENF